MYKQDNGIKPLDITYKTRNAFLSGLVKYKALYFEQPSRIHARVAQKCHFTSYGNNLLFSINACDYNFSCEDLETVQFICVP